MTHGPQKHHVLSFVEIDVPHCSLTYGVPPCLASLTGASPSLAFQATTSGTTTASVVTFNSLAIGSPASDRIVAVGITSQTDERGSTVTIAGISATKWHSSANTTPSPDLIAEIWAAQVPSGTTANVVVTLTGSVAVVVGISSFKITNASFTPTDTDQVNAGTLTQSITALTVPSNGAALLCSCNDAHLNGFTWTGATESSDANYNPHRHSCAITTTAGTNTISTAAGIQNRSTIGVALAAVESEPTGTIKCFNSLGTCQDRDNFTDVPVTFRFSEDIGFGPDILGVAGSPAILAQSQQPGIDAYPFIKSIDLQPFIVSLGGDLGQRATLKVVFRDAPHSDAGPDFDKYPADRDYSDPFNRGTFWGKFRARNPFLRGRNIRLIRGLVGQTLEEMETRYFVIDSIDGPNADGEFAIIGKDILKYADGDRSVAPLLSNGFLNADITNVATSATLSPSGIGNEQYPASGHVAIGGNEICSFTRSGDTLTLTRAQLNTVAVAHSAQDRVQLILRYVSADPADIIADLLETYSAVPSTYIPILDWQAETSGFLGNVYTLNITEPTSVNSLISELLTQMGAAIWWDDLDQLIHLQILRNVSTTAQRYNEDNVLANTLEIREQPEKRISQVLVYFGQINPLLKLDEVSNYRSTEAQTDTQSELDEGSAAIKKIFARGIAQGGRSIATRVAQKHLSRYVKPPRRFNFQVLRHSGQDPHLGIGVRLGGGDPSISSWPFQDETGARVDVPLQLTRHDARADIHVVEAEEMLFTQFSTDPIDTTDKTIILDANEKNVNLRTRHDELFGEPNAGDTITCIVTTGVIIGSSTTANPALDIGTWPAVSPAITINLEVRGRIEGCGGQGGAFHLGNPGFDGLPGGVALYTRQDIGLTLNVGSGEIWGGGGGGGGSTALGGGGGAGYDPGLGAESYTGSDDGQPGTTEAGGDGVAVGSQVSGNGGDPGNNGQQGTSPLGNSDGGTAGSAIDGVSFCTKTGTGDIRGSEVN